MEVFTVMAGVSPVIALLAIGIWRFTTLEAYVKHQGRCQRMLVKAVLRIGRQLKMDHKDLKELEKEK